MITSRHWKALGLKIDWTLDITPGDQVEALRSGKIDAICAAEGPMVSGTIKYLNYSAPIVYTAFYVYARTDDDRFASGIDAIDDPHVSMSAYFANNPGKLKKIGQNPLAIVPNTFSVLRNASTEGFLALLNQGIDNLRYTGQEKEISKIPKDGRTFFIRSIFLSKQSTY